MRGLHQGRGCSDAFRQLAVASSERVDVARRGETKGTWRISGEVAGLVRRDQILRLPCACLLQLVGPASPALHCRRWRSWHKPPGRYLSEDYGCCRLWENIGGELFVDAPSNLSHQGERLDTGDFGATLKTALPTAVGAPVGQRMSISGLENLKRKP
jgi:hypothetical protein